VISVFIGMAAIVIGTWLGAPTLAPIVVGVVLGVALSVNTARRAALAGVLAWSGLLLVAALRGDEIGALARTLGAAMGVPSWAFVLVTLLYPAILAASAAWLSHLAARRRFPWIAGDAALARETPTP
jgi:hypothetical protein